MNVHNLQLYISLAYSYTFMLSLFHYIEKDMIE